MKEINKGIDHISQNDPIIKLLIEGLPRYEMKKAENPFGSLVRIIVSQQLSNKAASTIISRVLSLFDQEINPKNILSVDSQKLQECGLSRSKIGFIKNLANEVSIGNVDLDKISSMKNAEAILYLCHLKGIGTWSAETYLLFVEARLNIIPSNDIGLKNAIVKYYKTNNPPTDIELKEIYSRWGNYASIACWYLWKAYDSEFVI